MAWALENFSNESSAYHITRGLLKCLFHIFIRYANSCDNCHDEPIVGPRFHRKGNDYDLCKTCFRSMHSRFSDVVDFQLFQAPGVVSENASGAQMGPLLRDFYAKKKRTGKWQILVSICPSRSLSTYVRDSLCQILEKKCS